MSASERRLLREAFAQAKRCVARLDFSRRLAGSMSLVIVMNLLRKCDEFGVAKRDDFAVRKL